MFKKFNYESNPLIWTTLYNWFNEKNVKIAKLNTYSGKK